MSGGELNVSVLHHGRVDRRAFVSGAAWALAAFSRPSFANVRPLNERLQGDIAPVHDPCIIQHANAYYVFSTTSRPGHGGFIACRRSPDLVRWEHPGFVFEQLPTWARTEVPRARGLWAPDISYFDGRYHLYYSVSSFGSNQSAIGVATNETLDADAPNFEWVDRGMVVRSQLSDDYNAIDPHLFIDRDGKHWLAFGSFWSGIKITPIDPTTGKPPGNVDGFESLARRPERPHSIEAPFLTSHDGWYYLFVSVGYCCRGVKSDYQLVCGRSKHVLGPYFDAKGHSLLAGGGTPVIEADDRFKGPGHNALIRVGENDYLVYHAYDAEREGTATLRISQLVWLADGWPQAQL